MGLLRPLRFIAIPLSVLLPVACGGPETAPSAAADEWLTDRPRTNRFYLELGDSLSQVAQLTLMQQVQAQMKAGGLGAAIPFCNAHALPLVDSLSGLHGVVFRRTSLRPRNAANAPDSLETAILQQWAAAIAQQPGLKPEGQLIRTPQAVHYLKPIFIQAEGCLRCHGVPGQTLLPEAAELLAQRYPQDQATGYGPGELRGAWHLSWPVR